MTSRYEIRALFNNTSDRYKNIFVHRDVNFIKQFDTATLKYPTVSEISNLAVQNQIWKLGDRYWKYASQYYNGRSDLWWVIAWFNKTPSEVELKPGDLIFIPTPIEKVLEYYGY